MAVPVSIDVGPPMMVTPTLTLREATQHIWDVIVIGAGPAGALAARGSTRTGLSVLLVDKFSFPRRKVCGCCINERSLSVLRAVGLESVTTSLGAVRLRELRLAANGCHAKIPLTFGVALSRDALDAALVEAAIASGASFLASTTARLGVGLQKSRTVVLRHGKKRAEAKARLVLAADGLSGSLLGSAGFTSVSKPGSRIGAGAMATHAPDVYRFGTIFMACGNSGYVGLVRVEDGRLNVAAALDPDFVKRSGGLGLAVHHIVSEAGLPAVEGLDKFSWRGTPPLTRRLPRVAADRVFVLGDAAGYVEPFTGEGIAWALSSGASVVRLVRRAVGQWDPSLIREWEAIYRKVVAKRQRICRGVAYLVKKPAWVHAAALGLSLQPRLVKPVVRHINAPYSLT